MSQYAFLKHLAINPDNTVIGIVRDKAKTENTLRTDGMIGVLLFQADIVDLPALKVRGKISFPNTSANNRPRPYQRSSKMSS